MLYENYQAKIKKIAEIKKRVYKFRVPIIIAIVVILASIAGFMGVKGVVYNAGLETESITYGQALPYSAKAYFGKVHYEYAKTSSNEWSESLPTSAGDYKVRAVSKRIFGGVSYGKEFIFTIIKKQIDININESSLVYGDSPDFITELAGGDTLHAKHIYTELNGDKAKVSADLDSVKITNKSGADVTACYDINVFSKEVTIKKRAITVKTLDKSVVYNGTEIFLDGIEILSGSLASGDDIQAAYSTSLIDAGESEGEADLSILNSSSEDMSGYYDINSVKGKLKVSKRDIFIRTPSGEKVYDGTPLVKDEFFISDDTPIAAGHTIIQNSAASQTEVGMRANVQSFKIFSGTDDVTSNYNFSYSENSVLKVTPRQIKIQSQSGTKVYDGTPLVKNDTYVLVSELMPIAGHTLTLDFSGTQTRAGSSNNTFKVASIKSGEINAIQNYSIEYVYGTLTVEKRVIKIQTVTREFTYNGTAQADSGFSVVSQNDLASGDRLIIEMAKNAKVTNVTETAENGLLAEVVNLSNQNVSDCYTINYEYGTLSVRKLNITVTTSNETLYYNGNVQTGGAHSVNIALPEGQTSKAVENTLLGLKDVEFDGYNYKNYVNRFDVQIFSGTSDVTYNYAINYFYGSIKMLPRAVNVKTASQDFVYNGALQSNNGYTLNPSLVNGDTATITTPSLVSLLEVEKDGDGNLLTYQNIFEIAIFNGAKNVSYNYTIIYEYGTIKMTPRPITVTTATKSWEYDGGYHYDGSFNLTSGTLVSGHSLSLIGNVPDDLNQIKNVIRNGSEIGTAQNKFSTDVFAGADNVSINYKITYVYGTLKITPRAIVLTTGDNTWVYDGTAHFENSYTLTTGELVSGQNIVSYSDTYITDVGNTLNYISAFVFDGIEIVTTNYNISYINGTLTVTKRAITVTTATNEWEYDGLPHSDYSHTITVGSLAGGQDSTWLLSSVPSIINVIRGKDNAVGSLENKFSIEIFDAYGEGVLPNRTSNYDITYVYGRIKILPRAIIIASDGEVFEYSGKPNTVHSASVYGRPLVEGHYFEATYISSLTDIGSIPNEITNVIILHGATDVSYNYDITLLFGSIIVTERTVFVSAGDAEKLFDGTALTCENYSVSGLLPSHSLTASTLGSQTEVGKSYNRIDPGSIVITDGFRDVSRYYRVVLYSGILHVAIVKIDVKTYDATKVYDGTPLTDDRYELSGDQVLAGHTVKITVYGSQTEIGSSYNDFYIEIKDGANNDVSICYLIGYELGMLTVTGAGNLDLSGDLDLDGDGTIDEDPLVLFNIITNYSGTVYFRVQSFGDYNFKSWDKADPYTTNIINPLELTGIALDRSGKAMKDINIRAEYSYLYYMIPYYARSGYYTLDDTFIDTAYPNPYYFSYIPYTYSASSIKGLSLTGTGYEQFEKDYYEYVKNTYLTLPETTRQSLLEVAQKNKLNASSANIISEVATYVQNKVKYSFDYDYKNKGDVAVHFFTKAETGICQHYATAATAMYRALGIPARYTGGFMAEATADREVQVTSNQAHAWVEVYISGIGWVQVEVTGALESAGGGSGNEQGGGLGEGDGNIEEEIPEASKPVLIIKPVEVTKQYDGTPLYATNDIESDDFDSVLLLETLKQKGYTYVVTVVGERENVGVSDSTIISFLLYDAAKKNVTNEYNIEYRTGRIRITNIPITIYLYSSQKFYDGTPLEFESDDYYVLDLPERYTLEFELKGSITNVGRFVKSDLEKLPFKVLDESGIDVSDRYSLVFEGEGLKIERRVIEITSASATKAYDGKPLTANQTWISKGFFPQGFTYEIKTLSSITDVGSTKNDMGVPVIYNAQGYDVTKNFTIKFDLGILTVV